MALTSDLARGWGLPISWLMSSATKNCASAFSHVEGNAWSPQSSNLTAEVISMPDAMPVPIRHGASAPEHGAADQIPARLAIRFVQEMTHHDNTAHDKPLSFSSRSFG